MRQPGQGARAPPKQGKSNTCAGSGHHKSPEPISTERLIGQSNGTIGFFFPHLQLPPIKDQTGSLEPSVVSEQILSCFMSLLLWVFILSPSFCLLSWPARKNFDFNRLKQFAVLMFNLLVFRKTALNFSFLETMNGSCLTHSQATPLDLLFFLL